mgnify:CR=1 FL=1|jgi:hypothetical protein
MQKQRDTKAIRRKPALAPAAAHEGATEEHDRRELADQESWDTFDIDKISRYDLGGDNEAYNEELNKDETLVIEVEKTDEGISVDQAEQEKEELETPVDALDSSS